MSDKKIDSIYYKLDPLYTFKGKVDQVVDADTVDATLDVGFNMFTKQRLRIDDFDAPETWRPKSESEKQHGLEATERAKELLLNKELLFITSKSAGIYGRFGAAIVLDNGEDFATKMISEGFAKRDEYLVSETE